MTAQAVVGRVLPRAGAARRIGEEARRLRPALLSLAVALALALAAAPAAAGDDARAAADAFGRALVTGRPEAMRPILPQRGKVHLALARLGPEEGVFGANQVEAVFRDFLAGGKVASFVVSRYESDGRSSALAHGKAAITDREGRSARIGVHLGFEPEDGRWVLREVKETAE